MSASSSSSSSFAAATPHPHRWLALAVLCAAQFIVILDTSIVGVALPAIQRSLGFAPGEVQWIFNAYVVAFGGLLLLGGRLADLLGARRVFGLGFALLTLASLGAGLATSPLLLLVARALQGAGAALIAPASLALILSIFGARPGELRKAFGLWGAAAAAGGTAGVFLGGVMTDTLGWAWTFLVNVPLGALVLGSLGVLPKGVRRHGSVDVIGAGLVTAGIALLVYGIVAIADSPLALPAITLAALLLVAFGMLQRRRREPLVPLALFGAPNLAVGNVVTALLGAAWIPLWFFLNLFLQAVLGLGALESGLALLPMTLAIMVLMIGATEKVVGSIEPKASLVYGLFALALALVLFARIPADGTFVADVLPPSLIAAIGMALAYVPSVIVATAGARPEDGGLASGLVNTSYQVGSAIGLAALVALAGSVSGEGDGTTALVAGYSAAFTGAAIVAAGAAVVALIAVRVPASQVAAQHE